MTSSINSMHHFSVQLSLRKEDQTKIPAIMSKYQIITETIYSLLL